MRVCNIVGAQLPHPSLPFSLVTETGGGRMARSHSCMRVHTHNTHANIIKIDVCVGVLAYIVFTFYERGKVTA